MQNMKYFAEGNRLNIFDYMPLTYYLDLNDENLDGCLMVFLKFFESHIPESMKMSAESKKFLNKIARKKNKNSKVSSADLHQ